MTRKRRVRQSVLCPMNAWKCLAVKCMPESVWMLVSNKLLWIALDLVLCVFKP